MAGKWPVTVAARGQEFVADVGDRVDAREWFVYPCFGDDHGSLDTVWYATTTVVLRISNFLRQR